MKKKIFKTISTAIVTIIVISAMSLCAFADGNVAGAIEGTWKSASGQIKQVVNNVVFPIIDLILAVFFFAKGGDIYRKYIRKLYLGEIKPADPCEFETKEYKKPQRNSLFSIEKSARSCKTRGVNQQ